MQDHWHETPQEGTSDARGLHGCLGASVRKTRRGWARNSPRIDASHRDATLARGSAHDHETEDTSNQRADHRYPRQSTTPEKDAAKNATMPELQAALTLEKYTWGSITPDAQYTIPELVPVPEGQRWRYDQHRGHAEYQMHTLDAMFNALARRAMDTTSMDQVKLWLTASLKTQRCFLRNWAKPCLSA